MRHVEGLILKSAPRREADAVFSIYTRESGLVYFQAKGIKNAQSKLKFGLSLFNWAQIYYVPSRYLPIITDIEIVNQFIFLKDNLTRLKLATLASKILRQTTKPGLADERVFKLLSEYFKHLNDSSLSKTQLLEQSYRWCYEFLVFHGLAPRVDLPPDKIKFPSKRWSEFKKSTQFFFAYHFGLDLSRLI